MHRSFESSGWICYCKTHCLTQCEIWQFWHWFDKYWRGRRTAWAVKAMLNKRQVQALYCLLLGATQRTEPLSSDVFLSAFTQSIYKCILTLSYTQVSCERAFFNTENRQKQTKICYGTGLVVFFSMFTEISLLTTSEQLTILREVLRNYRDILHCNVLRGSGYQFRLQRLLMVNSSCLLSTSLR
jgi:hypothetical protein